MTAGVGSRANAFKCQFLHLFQATTRSVAQPKDGKMNDKQPTEYLTKTELAAMLRVSTRTITNYIRTGAIPEPVKIGRKALWSRGELLAFVRAQQLGA